MSRPARVAAPVLVGAAPVGRTLLDGPIGYPADGDTVGAPHMVAAPQTVGAPHTVAAPQAAGAGPDDLAAHLRRFGPRPSCRGEGGHRMLHALDATALTGRGGGHFPVAAKWRRVLESRVRQRLEPVVIGNGAEGEPLSRKDRALLEHRPHLVLDGLVCAAETLGASSAVLWLHDDAPALRSVLARALAERASQHPGEPPVQVAVGPQHYLTGESSAVVNGVAGRPALPSWSRVPAAESGVAGRPTLVQNVETLARTALLARGGTADGVLVTVRSHERLVVGEFDGRTTAADAVLALTGAAAYGAVLVGGYGGRWLSWDDAARLALGPTALRGAAVPLGAGVLAPLPVGTCGLRATADIAAYLARMSARQCGPCHRGLPAIADQVQRLANARAGRRDGARLERFLAEVRGRGACHHPDGAVGLVRSTLETFADDVTAHLGGRCRHDARRGGDR